MKWFAQLILTIAVIIIIALYALNTMQTDIRATETKYTEQGR